ncbi:hypothetical protein [Burkholderia phage vB_BglM_WTB]
MSFLRALRQIRNRLYTLAVPRLRQYHVVAQYEIIRANGNVAIAHGDCRVGLSYQPITDEDIDMIREAFRAHRSIGLAEKGERIGKIVIIDLLYLGKR